MLNFILVSFCFSLFLGLRLGLGSVIWLGFKMNEWTKMSSVSVREQQHMMHAHWTMRQSRRLMMGQNRLTYQQTADRQTHKQTDRTTAWAVYVIPIHTSQQLLRQFKWSYSQKMILTFDLQWPGASNPPPWVGDQPPPTSDTSPCFCRTWRHNLTQWRQRSPLRSRTP